MGNEKLETKSENYEIFHAIYQRVKELGESSHFSILDIMCEAENDDEKHFFVI